VGSDPGSAAPSTAPFVIRTEKLSKRFRHPLAPWIIRADAVKSLDLEIRSGEVFGLLGPNGSGKSTAIKLILGLLRPSAGLVRVFGEAPSSRRVRARIGFVPEESYLYPYLSPAEILDFFGSLFSLPKRVRRQRTDALLDLVGLSSERNRPIGQFSKGMQRRVALAQSLINAPDLVILDEPTTGLDAIGIAEVKALVVRLRELGRTVVFCSHRMADVEDVCDRLTILYGGTAQVTGAISELVESERLRQITGSMSDATVDAVLSVIREREGAGVEVSVLPARERLESYFLRVVRAARDRSAPTSGAREAKFAGLEFLSRH
jgi:ABC-2 type transport system ATP-binding protein